jgi:AraC family transcriptional regulator
MDFPETSVAVAEHRGPPHLEYQTSMRLRDWRIANRVSLEQHRTYGVHFDDPRTTSPEAYRVDFCVNYEGDIEPNPQGVVRKIIPAGRCAVVRHLGSREHVSAAEWLMSEWLPRSGHTVRDFPMFFHYVNMGPQLREDEMITDVYLPIA